MGKFYVYLHIKSDIKVDISIVDIKKLSLLGLFKSNTKSAESSWRLLIILKIKEIRIFQLIV